jgi:hypothetical protein
MAVTYDAVGPAGGAGTAFSTGTGSWTHINGGNGIVVGCTVYQGTSDTITAVSYGGVALSKLGFIADSNGGFSMWGLVGATCPTGSNTVQVTKTGTDHCIAGSISVAGAGGFGTAFTAQNSGAVTSQAITVNGTTTGGLIVCMFANGGATTLGLTGGTQRWTLLGTVNTGADSGFGGTATSTGGGANQTLTATCTTADEFAIVAVEVLPSASVTPWQPRQQRYRRGPGGYRRPPFQPAYGVLQRINPAVTGAAVPVYTVVNSTIWSGSATTGYSGPLTVVPNAIGDCMVLGVINEGASGVQVASVSGGGCTDWHRIAGVFRDTAGTPNNTEIWLGTVSTTGSTTVSVTYSSSPGSVFCEMTCQSFHCSQAGLAWQADTTGQQNNASSGTITWPNLAANFAPEIYVGYAAAPNAIALSSPNLGFTPSLTSGNNVWTRTPSYSGGTPTNSVTINTDSHPLAVTIYAAAAPTAIALADVAAAVEAVAVPGVFMAGGGLVTGTTTPRSYPVAVATQAGDTLLVEVNVNNTTCLVTSVTDSKGNVYTLDGSWTSTAPTAFWYRSPGATGGSGGGATAALTTADTISVATTAAQSGNVTALLVDVPGVTGLDVTSGVQNGTNQTSASLTITPTVDSDVVVGLYVTQQAGGQPAVSAPFTEIGQQQSGANAYDLGVVQELGTGTAGVAQTSTITFATANWRGFQYAFNQAGATPVAVPDVAAGVEASAVTATVPVADVAAGVEAQTVAAAVPVGDVAGAAEALTVPAEGIPLADAAGAAESLTVAATVPLTERAAGVEAATANATVPLAEVAGGTDQVAIAAAVPLPDTTGAADEVIGVPGELLTYGDVGAASESLTVAATAPLADVAAGADSLAAAASVPLADPAGAAEALLSGMPVSFTEAAGASEALSVSVTCPVTDAGAASDSLTVSVTAGVSDQAGATDAISVPAEGITLADAGGAADSINALGSVPLADVAGAAELPQAIVIDAAGASDIFTVVVSVPLAERGAAADALSYTVGVTAADAAGAADALAIPAEGISLAEAAGASEALTAAASVTLTEAAGASDAFVVAGTGAPALAEAAGASEALAVTVTLALPDQGAGADAFSTGQGATPALTDAGGASDSLSVTAAAAVSFVDAGAATESAGAAVVAPAAESAGAAESAAVAVTLPLADQSAAVEALGASVSLQAAETAAATDQAQIAAQALAGDRAGATEALGVSKPFVGLPEAAAAADSLAVHVQMSFGPMPTFTPEPVDPVWMAFPDRPEWSSEAVAVRWTAVIEAGEWAADAAPMRWRIVMGVFEPIAAVSLENINARWTSDQDGVVIDPVAQNLPVQFAFPASSGDENHPAAPVTWYPGVWVTPNGTAKGFLAQCMVGPGGGVVALSRGSYDVWCKITTATEAPAKFVGVQAVY